MRRRFFGRFKARIPRKLKKAAKYGVERRIYQDENEISPITLVLKYRERVKFVVVGKRTKWKLKARLACEKEERQRERKEGDTFEFVQFWNEMWKKSLFWLEIFL